jgi:monovalent cation/hydrogen antiporter
MELFEVTVGLLLVAALLSTLADRIAVPYPTMLALAGAAAAFLPGVPEIALDPELVLALFVAPVLLDAAYDASPRDLRKNFGSVVRLALVAVGLTVAAVACVAKWCMPNLPWAAAVALGAIVAPPDAAAATAVLRRLKPPHRLLVILEGESLFNDAGALLIYRVAVGAAATGSFSLVNSTPGLLLAAAGSVALGWVLAHVIVPLSNKLFSDVAIHVLAQFLGTFFVWILAERLHLSAIIAVVTYGMVIGQTAARRVGGRRRIASYAVWDVAVFVLNAFAFLLIGLQMRAVIGRLDGGWPEVVLLAAATCLTVIAVRLVWVVLYNAAAFLWRGRGGHASVPDARGGHVPTLRGGLLISWAGMRGIVTLASALALPEDFPARDALVFTAVCVVLATLGLQGLTLGFLLRRLGLSDDGTVERESALARREAAEAAIGKLEGEPETEARAALLREYRARAAFDGPEPPSLPSDAAALQAQAVEAQRDRLEALRRDGTIGDTAYHAIEEELDLIELTADPRVRMA